LPLNISIQVLYHNPYKRYLQFYAHLSLDDEILQFQYVY
jgi:hypothetical protein